jgi:kumamolisin
MKRIAVAAEMLLLLIVLLPQIAVPSVVALSALPHVVAVRSSQSNATAGAIVRLGPLPSNYPLDIALVLRGQRSTDLDETLAGINDPHSPLFHHFLTPDQFSRRFGPTASAWGQVIQVLRAAGMRTEGADSPGSLLAAHGTAATVERLFGVRLYRYRSVHGEVYYSADALPHIPAAISADVSGVLGLDSRSHLQTRRLMRSRTADTPAAGGLEPADLARAYNFASLQSSGLLGTNETVGLAEIDAFSSTDVIDYDRTFALNAPPVQVVSVDGGASGHSAEATLDIETVQAVAPRAHILAYEGGQDLSQLAETFSRMVTDHRAQIISISLGVCELSLGGSDGRSFINAMDRTFQQASAEGISVLAASGDTGAFGCQDNSLSVTLPASDPYVTAVGGTTLFLNAGGSYGHEAGWEGPLEGAGTGGGLSQIYTRPSWQIGTGVINGASSGMREVPDVAADADPLTGYLIYFSGGWQVTGGTSAATPLWAGLIALADEAAATQGKSPLGFLNPALYSLGSGSASASPFHDVTEGGNLYYSAGPGWDYATGWGSPDAAILVPALLGV